MERVSKSRSMKQLAITLVALTGRTLHAVVVCPVGV